MFCKRESEQKEAFISQNSCRSYKARGDRHDSLEVPVCWEDMSGTILVGQGPGREGGGHGSRSQQKADGFKNNTLVLSLMI